MSSSQEPDRLSRQPAFWNERYEADGHLFGIIPDAFIGAHDHVIPPGGLRRRAWSRRGAQPHPTGPARPLRYRRRFLRGRAPESRRAGSGRGRPAPPHPGRRHDVGAGRAMGRRHRDVSPTAARGTLAALAAHPPDPQKRRRLPRGLLPTRADHRRLPKRRPPEAGPHGHARRITLSFPRQRTSVLRAGRGSLAGRAAPLRAGSRRADRLPRVSERARRPARTSELRRWRVRQAQALAFSARSSDYGFY